MQVNGGAWKRLEASEIIVGDDVYEIPFGDRTKLALVCSNRDGSYSGAEVWFTTDDRDTTFSGWFPPQCDSDLPMATLSGTAISNTTDTKYLAAFTALGATSFDNLPFSLTLPARPIDLVFYDNSRVVMNRDLDLTHGSLDVGTLDLASGAMVEEGSYTYDSVDPDETLVADSEVVTANETTFFWSHDAGVFRQAPDTVSDTDSEWTAIYANTATTSRSAEYDLRSVLPAKFTWLPRVSAIDFDPTFTAATFGDPGFSFTMTRLTCDARPTPASSEELLVSSPWLQLDKEVSFEFDHDIPGWDPAWSVAVQGRSCELAFEDRQSELTFKSTAAVGP